MFRKTTLILTIRFFTNGTVEIVFPFREPFHFLKQFANFFLSIQVETSLGD